MYQGLAIEISQVMPAAYAIGLFVSQASFVQPVQIQGATGNSIGGYTPIAGMQNIPAMNAPEATGLSGGSSNQKRAVDHIEADRQRHMLLKGYYPQLDTGFATGAGAGMQVQVLDPNGQTTLYDFLGGEGDSQAQMSRIRMKIVVL